MLKIAVCDDEIIAVEIIASSLSEQLAECGLEYRIDKFVNSGALMEKIQAGIKYDVLFADISMPGMNGIQLGLKLRDEFSDTILIFISSREDLVFDAFQAQPFRFVRKKKFHEELPSLVAAVCDEIVRRQKHKIVFQCKSSSIMLQPEKIVYVESYRKTQIIHYENQTFEIQSSLQKIMDLLNKYGFVQAHKSYYVNCRFIHSIDHNTLELDDHTRIPIGRSRLGDLKKAFQMYAMNK